MPVLVERPDVDVTCRVCSCSICHEDVTCEACAVAENPPSIQPGAGIVVWEPSPDMLWDAIQWLERQDRPPAIESLLEACYAAQQQSRAPKLEIKPPAVGAQESKA